MRTSTRMVVLGGFKGVLDLISVRASAAYGLRRLYGSWTGAAIRVMRTSDNSELDIGFIGEDLDVVTLLVFVGSGNGEIVIWYDQSGNGRHAVSTTAASRPRIVSNGVLETLNGKPAILFDGLNDNLQATIPSLANQNNISFFGVTEILTRKYSVFLGSGIAIGGTAGMRWGLFGQGNFSSDGLGWAGAGSELSLGNGSLLPINTPYQAVYTKTPTQWQILLNGSTISTVNDTSFPTSTYSLYIGAEAEGSYISNALASEIIIIGGILSTTDRQTLERNQGLYYKIAVN